MLHNELSASLVSGRWWLDPRSMGPFGFSFVLSAASAAVALAAALARASSQLRTDGAVLVQQLARLVQAGNAARAVKLCEGAPGQLAAALALAGLHAAFGAAGDLEALREAGVAPPSRGDLAHSAMREAASRLRGEALNGVGAARALGALAIVIGVLAWFRAASGRPMMLAIGLALGLLYAATLAVERRVDAEIDRVIAGVAALCARPAVDD